MPETHHPYRITYTKPHVSMTLTRDQWGDDESDARRRFLDDSPTCTILRIERLDEGTVYTGD